MPKVPKPSFIRFECWKMHRGSHPGLACLAHAHNENSKNKLHRQELPRGQSPSLLPSSLAETGLFVLTMRVHIRASRRCEGFWVAMQLQNRSSQSVDPVSIMGLGPFQKAD